MLSLILACVITYYFARDKFGEPTSSPSSEDILSRPSPKLLTTTAEYDSAYRLYITFMLGLVLMLSVAAPKILALDLESDSLAPAFLPLIAAFVVIGFLPSAPGFQDIEKRVRRFTHERGHIPRAARKVQEKLNAASSAPTPGSISTRTASCRVPRSPDPLRNNGRCHCSKLGQLFGLPRLA